MVPVGMAAVELHNEDDIEGPEAYACPDGTVWAAGFRCQ